MMKYVRAYALHDADLNPRKVILKLSYNLRKPCGSYTWVCCDSDLASNYPFEFVRKLINLLLTLKVRSHQRNQQGSLCSQSNPFLRPDKKRKSEFFLKCCHQLADCRRRIAECICRSLDTAVLRRFYKSSEPCCFHCFLLSQMYLHYLGHLDKSMLDLP